MYLTVSSLHLLSNAGLEFKLCSLQLNKKIEFAKSSIESFKANPNLKLCTRECP